MATKRDALGWTCFLVHIVVLLYVVLGWSVPARAWLLLYLVFLPGMFLHWKLNRDACLLNNLENWLRVRRWRAPDTNREEGAWLRTLLADGTGLRLSRGQMDAVIYGTMTLFWLLALARLARKF